MAKAKTSPNYWLFKQEPDCYSFAQLQADGQTVWDGITNALARKHLATVKKGDKALFYHTGKERAIVGEMKVVSDPYLPAGSDDPKAVVVDVADAKPWPGHVTLQHIKAENALADWDLLRLSRLSVVPVTATQWKILEKMSRVLA